MSDRGLKNKKNLIYLFLLALFVRLFFLFITDDGSGDPAGRVLEGQRWLEIKGPHIITYGYWLPLHTYLIGGMLYIWNEPSLSPRLLSLILGTITIFPFYSLVELLFNKKNALLSTLFLALFNFHILYSTQTLSEVPFVFFLICSIYFFFSFLKEKQNNLKILIISSVFLTLASMLRIEAWLFVPLIPLYLFKEKKIKPALIFFAISVIFPLFWILSNYIKVGDLLPLATINVSDTNLQEWNIFTKLTIYPYLILKVLSPVAGIISFYGMILSLRKRMFSLNIFFFTIFLFLVFTTIYGTNAAPRERYVLTISILLLPYLTIGFEEICRNLNPRIKTYFTASLVISILITYSYFYVYRSDLLIPKVPNDARKVAVWIKKNMKTREKVFLDNDNWWNSNIAILAGLNIDKAGLLVGLPFPGIGVTGRYYSLKDDGLIQYLEEQRPKYFIYAINGYLARKFPFYWKNYIETRLKLKLEFIRQEGNYIIYKIEYGKNKKF
ncbi:MAG: hypothetical protein A3C43_11935 [Candidatus Schekmanbacteria bacterium RIFCSPHIGHO2_02_FULL_38_11]|nr:MAG: hypothetical protein A3C43_11935 [Candidatus Schekmanbacteria bacterium RIFCSPHIGHO2_02_FULL_38_11]